MPPSVETVTYRPLLDILTEGRELPEGCDSWGVRAVHPDFRSSNGYRWPFPGSWAEAPGPILEGNTEPCPCGVGDGICTAFNAAGMSSGGIPALTVLVTAHGLGDVLGVSSEKARLRTAFVVDVIDLPGLAREGHLSGANLSGADLRGADLYGANLSGANLRSALGVPVEYSS